MVSVVNPLQSRRTDLSFAFSTRLGISLQSSSGESSHVQHISRPAPQEGSVFCMETSARGPTRLLVPSIRMRLGTVGVDSDDTLTSLPDGYVGRVTTVTQGQLTTSLVLDSPKLVVPFVVPVVEVGKISYDYFLVILVQCT